MSSVHPYFGHQNTKTYGEATQNGIVQWKGISKRARATRQRSTELLRMMITIEEIFKLMCNYEICEIKHELKILWSP